MVPFSIIFVGEFCVTIYTLIPKSRKYLKINHKTLAYVNLYRYIYTRKETAYGTRQTSQ